MPNQIDLRPELFNRHITHNPLQQTTIDPRKWVKTPFEMTAEILFGAVTTLFEDIQSAYPGIDMLGFQEALGGNLVQWVENFNSFAGVDFSGDPASWDTAAARQAFFTTVIEPLQSAVQGVINSVRPQWLPQVPLSSITDVNPNMLWNGGFDDPVSISTEGTDFVHDATVGVTGTNPVGSAKITFDGTDKLPLWGNAVPAVEGDVLTFTGKALWDSVSVAGGNSMELYATAFRVDDTLIEEQLIGAVASAGTAADWQALTGDYTAPAETYYVAMELRARQYATAGSGWFDECTVTKTPAFQIDWVTTLQQKVQNLQADGTISGLFVNGISADMKTEVEQLFRDMVAKFFNLDDLDFTPNQSEVKDAMGNLYELVSSQATWLSRLQAQFEQAQSSGNSLSVDFTDFPNNTALPGSDYETTYLGTGTALWGTRNGAQGWYNEDGNTKTARVRVLTTRPAGDFVIIRATLKDLPQNGGGKFHGVCRMTSDWQNYCFARGFCDGFLSYKGDLGCVVGGVEYLFAQNVPLSWNTTMTMHFGYEGNSRRFVVFSGNSKVVDYNEATRVGGPVSIVPSEQGTPSNYSFFGLIGNRLGSKNSGALSAFSMSEP